MHSNHGYTEIKNGSDRPSFIERGDLDAKGFLKTNVERTLTGVKDTYSIYAKPVPKKESGAHGRIKYVQSNQDPSEWFILKTLSFAEIKSQNSEYLALLNEYFISKTLQKTEEVLFVEESTDDKTPSEAHILLKYFPDKDLLDLLSLENDEFKPANLAKEQRVLLAKNIINEYLNIVNNHVYQVDINHRNIRVDSTTLKVAAIDFGAALRSDKAPVLLYTNALDPGIPNPPELSAPNKAPYVYTQQTELFKLSYILEDVFFATLYGAKKNSIVTGLEEEEEKELKALIKRMRGPTPDRYTTLLEVQRDLDWIFPQFSPEIITPAIPAEEVTLHFIEKKPVLPWYQTGILFDQPWKRTLFWGVIALGIGALALTGLGFIIASIIAASSFVIGSVTSLVAFETKNKWLKACWWGLLAGGAITLALTGVGLLPTLLISIAAISASTLGGGIAGFMKKPWVKAVATGLIIAAIATIAATGFGLIGLVSLGIIAGVASIIGTGIGYLSARIFEQRTLVPTFRLKKVVTENPYSYSNEASSAYSRRSSSAQVLYLTPTKSKNLTRTEKSELLDTGKKWLGYKSEEVKAMHSPRLLASETLLDVYEEKLRGLLKESQYSYLLRQRAPFVRLWECEVNRIDSSPQFSDEESRNQEIKASEDHLQKTLATLNAAVTNLEDTNLAEKYYNLLKTASSLQAVDDGIKELITPNIENEKTEEEEKENSLLNPFKKSPSFHAK